VTAECAGLSAACREADRIIESDSVRDFMRARTLPKEKCRVEQYLDSFKEEPGNEHG
jgi:hypothetical protein